MYHATWSLLVPICIDIFLDLIFVSRDMVRHFRVRGRNLSQSKISLACSATLKTISVIVVASQSRVLFGSCSLSTSKGDNSRSPSPSSASGQFASLLIKQNKLTKCKERNHFSNYFPYLTVQLQLSTLWIQVPFFYRTKTGLNAPLTHYKTQWTT